MGIRLRCARALGSAVVLAVFLCAAGVARAQESDAPDPDPQEVPGTGAVQPEPIPPPPGSHFNLGKALRDEAALYISDSYALVRAPLTWRSDDWLKFGGVVAVVGGVMAFDDHLSYEASERRSPGTNRFSSWTTRFGALDAYGASAALVVSGVVFGDKNVTSTGRDAIEASLFSSLLASAVKRVAGRQRPTEAGNRTVFEPGSGGASFPSGHATEAFAMASVISAHARGWVIPTLAYTAASLVAFDRVNDREHFPSDVVAGAALGFTVGRFVVNRHKPPEAPGKTALDLEIVPIRRGVGVVARF